MKLKQTTIARPRIELFAAIASIGIICLNPATAASTIVLENFGGTGDDLNGTTADTFAAGITTAGGSNTWDASTVYNDDGSLVSGGNDGAYLNMGSYINDSKGTAAGKFTLSATIGSVPTGKWAGFGFFESNTPGTGGNFANAGADGAGVIIYRETGELDGFAGLRTDNPVDGPDSQTGSQLLTIVLDLTPAGGFDGSTDYGTISFYQGDADTGTLLSGTSHTYTSPISFGSVGMSNASPGVNATFSGFELTQVPEPSALLLSGLSLLALLRRRR